MRLCAFLGSLSLVIVFFLSSSSGFDRSGYEVSGKALIEDSNALPFEYRADIQLSLIESGHATPPTYAIRVLDRLYDDADQATYAYKQKDITGNNYARSRRLDQAFSLNLDTLSIRSRVIRALSRFSITRSRQLLKATRLQIPSSPCTSPMVYDPSDFYNAVAELTSTKPDSPESDVGWRRTLLEEEIRQIRSPVQLARIADIISAAHLTRGEVQELTSLYARALRYQQASDRELGYIEGVLSSDDPHVNKPLHHVEIPVTLKQAIRRLILRNATQTANIVELLQSYRAFLTSTATVARCADITADRGLLTQSFNELLSLVPRGAVDALSAKDLKPSATAESAHIEWVPDAYDVEQGLTSKVAALSAAENKKNGQVNSLEFEGWEADANELLQRIDTIDTSQGTCHVCLFHEKAELIFALYDMTPPGNTKSRVLEHLISWMAADHAQQYAPLEWLYRFKLLLNLSRKPSEDQARRIDTLEHSKAILLFLPSKDGGHILDVIEEQGNSVMQIYVRAERLVKPPYLLPPYDSLLGKPIPASENGKVLPVGSLV